MIHLLYIEDVEHDVTADPLNNPNVPSLLTELAFDQLNINDGEGQGTPVPINYVSKYQSLICKISLIQQEAEELNDEILKNIKILSDSITCKLIDKTDSMRSAKISSYFKPNEKSTEHTEKDLSTSSTHTNTTTTYGATGNIMEAEFNFNDDLDFLLQDSDEEYSFDGF